jgi:hypothetical protein
MWQPAITTREELLWVRFYVLTAATMKMTVFWDVAPCSLVKFTDVSEGFTASIIRATIVLSTQGVPT